MTDVPSVKPAPRFVLGSADDHALHAMMGPFRQAHLDLVMAIAAATRARNIVELGSGSGVATRAFIEIARRWSGRVWSIDKAETLAYIELRDAPEIQFIIQDTVAAAAEWPRKWPIDLLYCDSDHSRKHVLAELVAWSTLAPKVIIVDDTLDSNAPHGSPLEAVWDFCRERPEWAAWNIPIGTGLAIVTR